MVAGLQLLALKATHGAHTYLTTVANKVDPQSYLSCCDWHRIKMIDQKIVSPGTGTGTLVGESGNDRQLQASA